MPKIFTEKDRDSIKQKLLQVGRDMLQKRRYKDISVSEIAAEVGIAKGTFYNFFASKELFFYEIMLAIRDENRAELIELAKDPTYDRVYEVMYLRYTEKKTVYDYFEPDELKIIFRKIPEKHTESDENSSLLAQSLLSACSCDSSVKAEVVVNLMNIAGSVSANREFLREEYYNETISVLAKAIADYIYGGNKNDA